MQTKFWTQKERNFSLYSYEERMKVIRIYINSNFRLRYTIRTLGYPSSRVTLSKWYKEYCEKHKLSKKYKRKKPKFSKKMINKVIVHYYKNGKNKTYTIRQLSYPCKYTLHIWLQKYSKKYTYKRVNSNNKFKAEQKATIVKDIVCNSKKAVIKFA